MNAPLFTERAPSLALPPDMPPKAHALPICGIVAIAVAAGVSFNRAAVAVGHARKAGRGRWKGGTDGDERDEALDLLGVPYKRWPERPCCRLANFPFQPGVTYIVTFTHHAIAFRDGTVADQSGVHPLSARPHFHKRPVKTVVELLR